MGTVPFECVTIFLQSQRGETGPGRFYAARQRRYAGQHQRRSARQHHHPSAGRADHFN